ncbi:MAG: hypothetical protein B7Y80_16320 [Hyphomicrobium sp. 32-62-53]|nr:MAG: hypothetical protein B7Z29_19015 [Hyphomicrobium sp. 12-62-95]OYX98302.1 MAG: hypothetical protein B7Y80_16320 [Hyphomicrobium sp. 32-62-53]
MAEVTYQLSQAGLTAYQFAVRDRLQKRKRDGFFEQPFVLWLILMVSAFAVTLAGVQAIERYLDRPIEMAEFFLGLFVGFSTMLATVWAHYLDQRRGVARPEGPILSPQVLRISADGVEIASKACDVRYRWPAIEAITEARGLIILWVEPGAGVTIPADAFASDAARAQFVAEAEAFRSAATAPSSSA